LGGATKNSEKKRFVVDHLENGRERGVWNKWGGTTGGGRARWGAQDCRCGGKTGEKNGLSKWLGLKKRGGVEVPHYTRGWRVRKKKRKEETTGGVGKKGNGQM